MKLHCATSPYHRRYLDKYLIPTAGREFEICVTETLTEPDNVLLFKAQSIYTQLLAAHARGEEHYFWCDNDSVFFKPCADLLLSSLGQFDVVFQNTAGYTCPGVFFARLTPKFIDFWKTIAEDSDSYTQANGAGDQGALRKFEKFIKAGMLPPDAFWSPCSVSGGGAISKTWMPDALPPGIRMAHMACAQDHHKDAVLDRLIELASLTL